MLITIKPDVNAVSIYICICVYVTVLVCAIVSCIFELELHQLLSLCMLRFIVFVALAVTVFAFMTVFVICSKCILWMYLQVCSRSCICICSRISRHSNELTCHIVSNLNRAHLRCTWAQNELEMHLPFRYNGRNGAWHMCVCVGCCRLRSFN